MESIDPAVCIKSSLGLHTNNLISTLLSLTVPSMVVKSAIVPGLENDSLSIRHEALTLLLAIVQQLKIVFLTINAFYKTSTIRNQMTDFVLRIIPNVEPILRVWNRAFEIDSVANDVVASESAENIQNPELVDHFDTILNILYSYKDICPELLDGLTDLRPNKLLSRLNDLQNDNGEADKKIQAEKMNRIKIKTIQFLLALDSSSFAPRERTFKETLFFLISQIRRLASPEGYDAIRILLKTTSLFEACDDQLDIWITAFSVMVDSEENEELMQWFISVLRSAIKHIDKYTNNIMQVEGTINEQVANLDVKKAEDIINELFDKANESSLSEKEFSIAGLSLVNRSLNHRVKKNDIINGDIDKLNKENSKDVKYINDKYVIHLNEQVSNLDMEKMDIINELFDKGNGSFPFNSNYYTKDFSTSRLSLINGLDDLDIKKIDDTVTINDTFNKLHEGSCVRMQAYTSVSPLLYCALQKTSEKNYSTAVSTYLSYVTVHTLHHQVIPELLVHMAGNSNDLPVYKYLQSWSNNSEPISLKSKLPSLKLLQKMSNVLLTNIEVDVTELSKLFSDGHSTCCFQYGDQEITIKHSLSLHDIRALLKMTTFYLAQLAQRGFLRKMQNENCKIVLVFLLNIAQSMDRESIVIFEESTKCIFTHPILLHYFSPFLEVSKDSVESKVTHTILEICKVVVNLQEKHGGPKTAAYNIFSAFRDKFLTQLRNIINRNSMKVCSDNYDIAIALLKVLLLRVPDIMSLLLALMELEKDRFVSSDKRSLSLSGHIVPVLLDVFCEKKLRSHQRDNMLDDQFVAKLSLHLVYLRSIKINVERWERALIRYLSIFSHNIAGISADTFALLLLSTKDFAASTIELATILIAKNTKLIPPLVKYFLKAENAKRGDVAFPILASNLKYNWNEKFLRRLYECHVDNIIAYLTEPATQTSVSWIEENTVAVVYLIENTFELALCEKTCDSISQNGDKLDMVPICFVQLLESLYKKYESLIIAKEKPLTDLTKILVHIMTSTLKKESKNIEKIRVLCEKLDNVTVRLRELKPDFIFSSLSKSYSWPQFTRFSLKLGLKDAKDDGTQLNVLKTLSNLCDIAYEDNIDDENAKMLFEMVTFHSEFVNIMLGSSKYKGKFARMIHCDCNHLFVIKFIVILCKFIRLLSMCF